jgi:membrane associated rhomboid family serine protease
VLIPLRDHNPRLRFPVATLLLIGINVVVWLFEWSMERNNPDALTRLLLSGGAIPYEIVNHKDLYPPDLLPLPGSILTSMFLHGGWLHLIGNMWFLWIFGDNVEETLGTVRYLIFYVLSGTIGALAQAYSLPQSLHPMIGASGAVAGILGGYLMLYPRAKVVTLILIPFWWPIVDIAAWIFLGFWFFGQFLMGDKSGVAWMAHVGGFLAGLGAVRLLARQPRGGGPGRGSPTGPGDGPGGGPIDVEYLPPRARRW